MDETFASKNKIWFEKTCCQAKAAGSTNMKLSGQTTEDVMIKIKYEGPPIILKLGRMVVVKNLGVSILIGEPAKVDNKIVTIPHLRQVEVTNA